MTLALWALAAFLQAAGDEPRLTFLSGTDMDAARGYLVEFGGARVLVECGLPLETHPCLFCPGGALAGAFPLDSVLLTHAHTDHGGGVPELFAHAAAAGERLPEVLGTEATKRLFEASWRDAGRPPHGTVDVAAILERFRTVDRYGASAALATPRGSVEVVFHDASHIPGSASLEMRLSLPGWARPRVLLVSGDLGTDGWPYLSPLGVEPAGEAVPDVVVVESTYGAKVVTEDERQGERAAFEAFLERHLVREPKTIYVPAFTLDRTQKVVVAFQMWRRGHEPPPEVPVYVGSARARELTSGLYGEIGAPWVRWPEPQAELLAFDVPGRDLGGIPAPALVIVPGYDMGLGAWGHGLREAVVERVRDRGDAALAFVGWMGEDGSPARRILAESEPFADRVGQFLSSFSGHADQGTLVAWVQGWARRRSWTGQVAIVHGEAAEREGLRAAIAARLPEADVRVPANGEAVIVGEATWRVEHPQPSVPPRDGSAEGGADGVDGGTPPLWRFWAFGVGAAIILAAAVVLFGRRSGS